ncbi:MAG: hypothetical protein WBI82_10045 [Sphaerochaeta sp.]
MLFKKNEDLGVVGIWRQWEEAGALFESRNKIKTFSIVIYFYTRNCLRR